VDRPQPEPFDDLQQAERRWNVACDIDRECIGQPLLEQLIDTSTASAPGT